MIMPTSKDNELLAAALGYARVQGWSVFPCHSPTIKDDRRCSCNKPDCTSIGKHPRITEWQKKATTDEKQIREWWDMWPDANVAIMTGAASGIVVLDVDGEEGFQAIKDKGYDIPTTYTVITRRGKHFYYKHPGYHVACKNGLLPKVDLKADGGYVIAPPSRYVNGGRYEN